MHRSYTIKCLIFSSSSSSLGEKLLNTQWIDFIIISFIESASVPNIRAFPLSLSNPLGLILHSYKKYIYNQYQTQTRIETSRKSC